MTFHIPVLLNEILAQLEPQPGQIIVDGTLGGGGHSVELAKRIQPNGTLIGLDVDPFAIEVATQKIKEAKLTSKIILLKDNYRYVKKIINDLGIEKVDSILIDIGISSYDLEGSHRGFSFQKDEPLDMRFDPEATAQNRHKEPFDAAYIVNHYEEQDLKKIFDDYGEDKHSSRIARAIVARRQETKIKTTTELFEIIKKSLPAALRFKAGDNARRIFQSLRIEVNHELDNLKNFLPNAFEALAPNGKLAVISFHSLEDRMVKQFFLEKARGCICPSDFPECRCGKTPEGKILTRKIITASQEEIIGNSRSAPAKLRVIQKI